MRTNHRSARTLPVALAAGSLLLVAACGSGDDSGSASGDGSGSQNIAAVIKGLDNPFFQTMQEGIQAQATESGAKVEVQAAASITDTTGQAEKLTALAQQDYGCFVVNPISGNNLVQGLARVAQKDVPVVNIDRPIDADAADAAGLKVNTYIGTDNVAAAELAGARMTEKLGGSGKVAVIGGIAGDPTSADRVTGFTQAATGLTLLPVQAADWERQKALTAVTDLMQANPDLKGIFAANDDMGLGAARAVATAGKKGQITVLSVDGNQEAIEAVQAGDLDGTVAQYPYAVGQLGVQACEAAIAGKELPENVVAPVALVTADKAEDALAKFPQPFEEYENPLAALTAE